MRLAPSLYDDMNPEWAAGLYEQPEWEPWQDDEQPEIDEREGGCHYCGAVEIRDTPDPYGQQPVCDDCVNELISGERGDPPWRCGNCHPVDLDPEFADVLNDAVARADAEYDQRTSR